MKVEDTDDKNVKASKQSRRDLHVILALIGLLVLGVMYFNNATGLHHLKKSHLPMDNHEMMKRPPSVEVVVQEEESEENIIKAVQHLDEQVRAIKAKVDIFETDPQAKEAAKKLQAATQQLLHKRYGTEEPYRVVVDLEFQDTIPDFAEKGKDGSFTIELAPSTLQPHSIYTFLEVARNWNGGAFHRIAPHVLQVMVKTHTIKHLAFQEYSPEYPHKERTVGYAGRPSGPAWYVSIQDNSRNHGPGSQQQHNPYEADSCFGTVVEGYEHVLRIKKVPGTGFLGDAKKHVIIKNMTIQVPRNGAYETWTKQS